MSVPHKRIQELLNGIHRAWELLSLDGYQKQIETLEKTMQEPHFWGDVDRAKHISQEAASLKSELTQWEEMRSEVSSMSEVMDLAEQEGDEATVMELIVQLDQLEGRFERMERQVLMSGDYDKNHAIVSVYAGAGGQDAMDWASMLTRMYMRFAQRQEWDVEVLEESLAEDGGVKSMTVAIRGRYAYGQMKVEAGVHRLVRISPFDAEGMRHTSFALISVIPELDEVTEKQIEINPDDLRIDTYMSSGKGGQSVNTTYSAIRITHIPTNTVVTCQNERSQQQNKESAMRVLKSRLFKLMQEQQAARIDEIKGGHKPPEWGNQIRSYVLHPYKLVKDHRTNTEVKVVDDVLDGNIDLFIDAQLRAEAQST